MTGLLLPGTAREAAAAAAAACPAVSGPSSSEVRGGSVSQVRPVQDSTMLMI
jgi:hypothetical protein